MSESAEAENRSLTRKYQTESGERTNLYTRLYTRRSDEVKVHSVAVVECFVREWVTVDTLYFLVFCVSQHQTVVKRKVASAFL